MIVYFAIREQAEAGTVMRIIDCCRSEYFLNNCISEKKKKTTIKHVENFQRKIPSLIQNIRKFCQLERWHLHTQVLLFMQSI